MNEVFTGMILMAAVPRGRNIVSGTDPTGDVYTVYDNSREKNADKARVARN